jgi:glycosyltransferase involved in cell wall biosynthesis
MEKATIGLSIIVKNEEKVLPRLLESIYSILDYYIIVDTGSTDNTKKIAEELPLSKYNIDKSAALTGNPALLNSLVRDIEEAINDNKDNPDNLYEILEIAKTIAAYWLDLIFSITNALMLIIDVLSIMAVIIDGPLPIGDVASGIFGALASFGLIGVEFAAEHYVDEYWKRQTEKIKYIAEKNIKKLGGEIPEETSESSDSSQLSRGENAPTNRTYDLLG